MEGELDIVERSEYQRRRNKVLEQLNYGCITPKQCGEKLKILTKLYKDSQNTKIISIEKCPQCNRDIYSTKKGEYINLRMEGITYKEIAKIFGISVSSLRSIRYRWNVDADIDSL